MMPAIGSGTPSFCAGPAGAIAARYWPPAARVLLVEKKAFPRGKVCGACLNELALGVLESVGLSDLIAALGGTRLKAFHSVSVAARCGLPFQPACGAFSGALRCRSGRCRRRLGNGRISAGNSGIACPGPGRRAPGGFGPGRPVHHGDSPRRADRHGIGPGPFPGGSRCEKSTLGADRELVLDVPSSTIPASIKSP